MAPKEEVKMRTLVSEMRTYLRWSVAGSKCWGFVIDKYLHSVSVLFVGRWYEKRR